MKQRVGSLIKINKIVKPLPKLTKSQENNMTNKIRNQTPTLRAQGYHWRQNGDKKRKWKILWVHRVWSSKHRACVSLDQFFCTYIIASSLVFLCDSWLWKGMDLWHFCLLLKLFFLLLGCYFQHWYDSFALYDYIFFCHVSADELNGKSEKTVNEHSK